MTLLPLKCICTSSLPQLLNQARHLCMRYSALRPSTVAVFTVPIQRLDESTITPSASDLPQNRGRDVSPQVVSPEG